MTDTDARQPLGDRRRIRRLRWLGMCCLGIIVLLLASIPFLRRDEPVVSQEPRVEARPVAASDIRPIENLLHGFASSDACQQCHRQQHRSWHASYHRTMTQVVDAETAPAAIRDTSVTVEGELYEFEQDGDQFFVTFRDPLVALQFRRRQVVMMTGSHHMHIFWYASGFKGTPSQLPILYVKDEGRWMPRRSAFLRPPDMPKTIEFGRWNETCCKCHSTRPRQRPNREAGIWDTHVVEFGIACEACHGQGAAHIQQHSSDTEETAELAELDKIINPLTVSHRASSDICGQCHSISMPDFDVIELDEFFQHGNPFEPGQLLAEFDFTRVIQATPEHRESDAFHRWSQDQVLTESFWSDGMPRVSGREYNGLIESPCYLRGEMSCLSCHTMHPDEDQSLESWRDDQLKPGMRGDQACLQCHSEYAGRITEHTHHAPESSGSRCMNCHMPYTTYGLLKTIRSHQISSPQIATSVATGRASACNLCHLDRSVAWTSGHMHRWYDQPELKLENGSEADTTATAALHLLRGDAAQRAIMASAFGWPPAREASGTQWMEPLLLLGTNDPYDAVRIISARSLRSLPSRITDDVDPLAHPQQRFSALNAAVDNIDKNLRVDPKPEVLFDSSGMFDFMRARKLIEQRNHRPIYLRE